MAGPATLQTQSNHLKYNLQIREIQRRTYRLYWHRCTKLFLCSMCQTTHLRARRAVAAVWEGRVGSSTIPGSCCHHCHHWLSPVYCSTTLPAGIQPRPPPPRPCQATPHRPRPAPTAPLPHRPNPGFLFARLSQKRTPYL